MVQYLRTMKISFFLISNTGNYTEQLHIQNTSFVYNQQNVIQ